MYVDDVCTVCMWAKLSLEVIVLLRTRKCFYFGGLLDSPSSNDINMFHNINKLTKRISPVTMLEDLPKRTHYPYMNTCLTLPLTHFVQ